MRRAAAGIALSAAWSIASHAADLAAGLSVADALRLALSQNPAIQIQRRQIDVNEGAVLQARGTFDPEVVLRSQRTRGVRPLRADETATLATLGARGVTSETNAVTAYGVGVEKTFLSGVRASTGIDFSGMNTNVNNINGIPRQLTGTVRFDVRVPLARNSGESVVGAQLRASESEREASREDLVQTASTVVLQTALAYWDLASRTQRLAIATAAENRAVALVAELRKLIAADQIPAADLNLAAANEAEKQSARTAAQQNVQEAWANLARQIGVSAAEYREHPVSSELPAVSSDVIRRSVGGLDAMRASAIETRRDLKAARIRERAANELRIAAQGNLRPLVDLTLGVTRGSLVEGASTAAIGPALSSDRTGATVVLGLEMRWPFANDTARGVFLSRSAGYDQALIRVLDLERSVATNVATLVGALRRVGERYDSQRAAAERYSVSVGNEQTKRRLGLATLIDVLNVQDRLDNAQLALLQLQQEYAAALAQLDFEIGRIVLQESDGYAIDLLTLTGARPLQVTE